jgi:hypothetical protein
MMLDWSVEDRWEDGVLIACRMARTAEDMCGVDAGKVHCEQLFGGGVWTSSYGREDTLHHAGVRDVRTDRMAQALRQNSL